MSLEIRCSCPAVSSVLENWNSAKLHKFYKKVSVIESFLSKTLSPNTYNCTSKDTMWEYFMWEYFFIALFHASIHSQMFYKIDVLENCTKFTGNALYQTHSTLAQCFPENFSKFLGTPSLQNTSERLVLISIQSSYCFKTFLFNRTDQYLLNIPSYFRISKFIPPSPLGPCTVFE